MEEFEILGTVLSYTTKKGKLLMNDRNLAGERRVMIRMVNDKGAELETLLSSSLSADLRAKKITVGNLMTLSYGVNADGRHYICQPAGNTITVEVKSLDIKEVEMEEIDVEDLIAL